MQTKAVLDRLQLVLADRCQHYFTLIQPTAKYLGQLLRVDKHGVFCNYTLASSLLISLKFDIFIGLGFSVPFQIDVFTEEVIRAGPGAVLSTLVNRFDPSLRKIANLGW